MFNSNLKWVYFSALFIILLLPALSLPPLFAPPAFTKALIFRIIFGFLLVALVFNILFFDKTEVFSKLSNPGSKILIYILAALLLSFGLATLFSVEPGFSFKGDPFRGGGFLNFALYIGLAILSFLVFSSKDWPKIWNLAFIGGALVSGVGIFQRFGILKQYFMSHSYRPPATLGNPILFAIYILLLWSLALIFFLKSKGLKSKAWYGILLGLFSLAIIITQTRAAFLGLGVGIVFFILFYPKKALALKIPFALLLLLGVWGFFYLRTHPESITFENPILEKTKVRILSISLKAGQKRFSAWNVGWSAFKERPVLGWGPENFVVAFDRYYQPTLSRLATHFGGDWWDRAHNKIVELAVTCGALGLMIYLSLFLALFWKLQQLKSQKDELKIISHGLQTGLIAYFTANLTSFDTFSTYLIFFLIVGYILDLTYSQTPKDSPAESFLKTVLKRARKYRGLALVLIIGIVIWFSYFYGIKPLVLNRDLNVALYWSKQGKCHKALKAMDRIKEQHSILDNYTGWKYTKVADNCINGGQISAQEQVQLAQKVIQVLEKNTKIRSSSTRTWILLGFHTNFLIQKVEDPEIKQTLTKKADYYLNKAHQLSPNRTDIISEMAKTYLLSGQPEKAKNWAQKCIDLNPEGSKNRKCFWQKGLALIYLGKTKAGQESIKLAQQKGYPIHSKNATLAQIKAWGKIAEKTQNKDYYQPLVGLYSRLLKKEPKNIQYHASLAFVYQKLGDINSARKQALKVLELSPESKPKIEEFLKDLKS